MMIKSLNSEQILVRIRELVQKERTVTLEILHYLREIEERQIYAERGYPSLFEFCVEVLKYSRGAASRRIRTMRLMMGVPEVEQALLQGDVSLTTASVLQSFFQNEPTDYSPEEKRELFKQILGKSKTECEKLLVSMSSDPARFFEGETVVTQELTEVRFLASDQLLLKLQKIKNLSAHRDPNPSYADLIEWMADITLEKLERQRKAKTKSTTDADPAQTSGSQPSPPENPKQTNPRSRSAALTRSIWKRDQDRCQYKDPLTGRLCHSEYAVEMEHIIPIFFGGKSTPENLQLLCRTHNQLRARQLVGELLMSRYRIPRRKRQGTAQTSTHDQPKR